jgi:hypothetical protein
MMADPLVTTGNVALMEVTGGGGGSATSTEHFQGINFNPKVLEMSWSAVLADIRTKHKSHQRLRPVLEASSSRCEQHAKRAMVQQLECPDYNALATSLMHATELHVAKGGLFLEFESLKMQARASITEPFVEVDTPLYNGRLLLTNSRVLALSSAAVPLGKVERQGPATKANKKAWDRVWYEVSFRSADNIVFRPYNLDQFTHFQLRIAVASTTLEIVKAPERGCCCFCCCGCRKDWHSFPSTTVLEDLRTFDLYVTNGPWSPREAVKMTVQVSARARARVCLRACVCLCVCLCVCQ